MPKEKEIQEASELYEIGLHFVSTIPAEKAADEFSKLKALIEKNGGQVVKEGEPKLVNLAYTMTKKIAGSNQRFNQAHFAFVIFNLAKNEIHKIKEDLDLNEKVLRHLIIKTANDYDHSTNRLADEMKSLAEAEEAAEDNADVENLPEEILEETKVKEDSNKEIDEAIDEMVK